MNHEPLCPMFEQCDGNLAHEATPSGGEEWCQRCDARCQCSLIAKVREETFAAAVQRVEALPWTSENWIAHAERAAIIAAIDALRKETT